jgi:aldehyde dehydrogenase (NAD(P)+)
MDSIISPEKVLGTSNPPASDLEVQLTAPNGRKYTQPIGLFINNEWVKSSNEQKLASISPMYESTID